MGYGWGFYYGFGGSWGWGSYPWRFSWPAPVAIAYVPYGFYVDQPTILVEEVVEETVLMEQPLPPEEGAELPAEGPPPEQGEPPVLDAMTEKYLRDGSEAFAKRDYEKAAEAFRMAVVSSPDVAPPRFAFGQALIAIKDYPYAARVLRAAILKEPVIVNAPGSIAGVYENAEEFQRVLDDLTRAWVESEDDSDILFLLMYEQYFSGDPRAVATLARLREIRPEDPTLSLFEEGAAKRFSELETFPPSEKVEKPEPK